MFACQEDGTVSAKTLRWSGGRHVQSGTKAWLEWNEQRQGWLHALSQKN